MISHPSVAGAAVLAGLMVAGGAYAARHDVGVGSGLQASATARVRLEQELPLGRERHAARHILAWHPPHVPKIHVHHTPPAAVTAAGSAPTYVAAAPVATTAPVTTRTSPAAPVTRTSPVGDDGGSGDD